MSSSAAAVTLRVSNTAEPTGCESNPFAWQLFVRPAAAGRARISRVSGLLHPSFRQRHLEFSRTTDGGDGTAAVWCTQKVRGWGTFAVGLTIELEGVEASLKLQHQLVFSRAETAADHAFEIELEAAEGGAGVDEEEPESSHSATCGCAPAADATVAAATRPAVVQPAAGIDAAARRARWQAQLSATGFLEPSSPRFQHGRAFAPSSVSLPPPPPRDAEAPALPAACPAPARVTWRSAQKPREDHEDAASWLTASEFADGEQALDAKLQLLGELLKLSNKTVVYSGAGLSVAAGIGQAARGAARGGKSTDATPTAAHYALGELHRAGLLHGWVQQNHDGLPQKAGFPQEAINEIHGSWYDPSNPVVKYSGSLKGDCYPSMRAAADSADLVLVIGTTLGGLNADQVATKPAERSLRPDAAWDGTRGGGALGTVIINLQQTEQDGKATLRLFGKADDVLQKLVGRLGLRSRHVDHKGGRTQGPTPAWLKPPRMPLAVPYDSRGARTAGTGPGTGPAQPLDLRPGARVRLSADHNVQGAQQPAFMHIGAGAGVGVVKRYDPVTSAYVLEIEGVQMRLGVWWAHAAARGAVEQLPVFNC